MKVNYFAADGLAHTIPMDSTANITDAPKRSAFHCYTEEPELIKACMCCKKPVNRCDGSKECARKHAEAMKKNG